MLTEVSEITQKINLKKTCIKQDIKSIHMHSLGTNGKKSQGQLANLGFMWKTANKTVRDCI